MVAALFVFFVFFGIWASRYTKVGPNQVLVISGRKHQMADPDGNVRDVGFRIVKGGGVLCGRCSKRWTFFRWNF